MFSSNNFSLFSLPKEVIVTNILSVSDEKSLLVFRSCNKQSKHFAEAALAMLLRQDQENNALFCRMKEWISNALLNQTIEINIILLDCLILDFRLMLEERITIMHLIAKHHQAYLSNDAIKFYFESTLVLLGNNMQGYNKNAEWTESLQLLTVLIPHLSFNQAKISLMFFWKCLTPPFMIKEKYFQVMLACLVQRLVTLNSIDFLIKEIKKQLNYFNRENIEIHRIDNLRQITEQLVILLVPHLSPQQKQRLQMAIEPLSEIAPTLKESLTVIKNPPRYSAFLNYFSMSKLLSPMAAYIQDLLLNSYSTDDYFGLTAVQNGHINDKSIKSLKDLLNESHSSLERIDCLNVIMTKTSQLSLENIETLIYSLQTRRCHTNRSAKESLVLSQVLVLIGERLLALDAYKKIIGKLNATKDEDRFLAALLLLTMISKLSSHEALDLLSMLWDKLTDNNPLVRDCVQNEIFNKIAIVIKKDHALAIDQIIGKLSHSAPEIRYGAVHLLTIMVPYFNLIEIKKIAPILKKQCDSTDEKYKNKIFNVLSICIIRGEKASLQENDMLSNPIDKLWLQLLNDWREVLKNKLSLPYQPYQQKKLFFDSNKSNPSTQTATEKLKIYNRCV